jgi:DNA polymerase-3 subunit alpha
MTRERFRVISVFECIECYMSEPISLAPPPELLPYDGPLQFVHLHNHTVFSQLDGVATPEQYFAECKKRGYPAMAITEHGHMASVPDNYWASAEHKIKYIPGCEVYYNDFELQRQQLAASGGSIRELKVSDPILHAKMSRNRHMTILAKDQTGFHNLVKLTTQAYDTGFYYRPRVWFDKVAEYSEGLIVLSGCLNGPVSTALRNGEIKVAEDYIVRFKALLGDRYWIEVQMPCLIDVDDRRIFAALINRHHNLLNKEFFSRQVMAVIG